MVAAKEHYEILSRFLSDYIPIDDKILIDLVTIPNDEINGSADYVRAVSHKITSDFIVVNGDMISEVSIAELTRLHRLRNADMVVLLTPFQNVDNTGDEKKSIKNPSIKVEKKVKIDEEDQEYIGICSNDGRLILKSSVVEIEKNITLDKRILNKCSDSLVIHNDLLDVGIYIFSHWILHLLNDKKKITSIKIELIPYLLNKQFIQNTKYLISAIGDSLLQRATYRHLNEVDTYLYNTNTNTNHIQTQNKSISTGTNTNTSSGSGNGLKDLSSTVLEQFLMEIDNKETSKSTHHTKLIRQATSSPAFGAGNDRDPDLALDSDGNDGGLNYIDSDGDSDGDSDSNSNSNNGGGDDRKAPKFTGDMENALKTLANVGKSK